MTRAICTLPVGSAFRLLSGKSGVVERHNSGSTSVRYDARRETRFTTRGGEEVFFDAPERTHISPHTEVVSL